MTLTDLYRRTLQKLQVIAAEESGDASDLRVVEEKYTSLHGQLTGVSLCDWGASEEVPLAVEIPIVDMLACVCASDFGLTPNYLEGALALPPDKGGPSLAERQLRRVMARSYVSRPAESEFF